MENIFNLFSHASFALEFMASNIKSLVRDNSNYLPIGKQSELSRTRLLMFEAINSNAKDA